MSFFNTAVPRDIILAQRRLNKLWKLKWSQKENKQRCTGSPTSWFGVYLKFWDLVDHLVKMKDKV